VVAAAVVMIALQGDLFGEAATPPPDLAHSGRVRVFRVGDQVAGESSGRRIFGDCPACGVFVPVPLRHPGARLAEYVPYQSDQPAGYHADRFWLTCPGCGVPARGRAIVLRQRRTPTAGIVRGGRRYCNGACLNGRHSCDCTLCLGRCHGAGTCTGH
jgi:hypothetical protein